MRVMAQITLPVQPGNRAVKDGTIGNLFQSLAERWHPEAMYFGTLDGRRTGYVIFDMPDPSDMVAFAEPFFSGVDADVMVVPVMNAEDLQQGLAKLG